MELKKRIVFVDYEVEINDIIKEAPDDVKPLFKTVESIPFRTRSYEMENNLGRLASLLIG